MTTWHRFLLTLCATCYFLPVAAAEAPTVPVAAEVVIFTKRGEVPVNLELATTPEAREKGLMKRDSLKPYDGMLFVFPESGDYQFWMKNTLIPLDMLFIRSNHTIAHIASNATPHSLAPHGAGEEICAVIELDGGRASREGIAEGDHVRYALPDSVEIR